MECFESDFTMSMEHCWSMAIRLEMNVISHPVFYENIKNATQGQFSVKMISGYRAYTKFAQFNRRKHPVVCTAHVYSSSSLCDVLSISSGFYQKRREIIAILVECHKIKSFWYCLNIAHWYDWLGFYWHSDRNRDKSVELKWAFARIIT